MKKIFYRVNNLWLTVYIFLYNIWLYTRDKVKTLKRIIVNGMKDGWPLLLLQLVIPLAVVLVILLAILYLIVPSLSKMNGD